MHGGGAPPVVVAPNAHHHHHPHHHSSSRSSSSRRPSPPLSGAFSGISKFGMTKPDYDALALIRANISILYPQYPASTVTPTISTMVRKDGRLAYYVAIFVLLPDTSASSPVVQGLETSVPRLLETGPPKNTVPEALEAMIEGFLGRDVARVVNEQACMSTKVARREGDLLLGYTFVWGDQSEAVNSPTRPQNHEPPPAYGD